MKRRILVIGANSALAQDVIPVLLKNNSVITAGRSDCDVYCDVSESVSIPEGIDAVINFTAHFGGNSDVEINDAVQTNMLGMLRICQAAKSANVGHIINISSVFTLLDENSSQFSIYALTKKQADDLSQYYCRLNQIPLTILRPSRIYGDSDSYKKNQPFFYAMVDKAQNGEDIAIYGTNDASRNYIHAGDLAEVITRVVAGRVEGTYACVYPENSTYSQIAEVSQKVFGRGGTSAFLADKPDIADDTYPLDQAIYNRLDYQPHISLLEGMERIKNYRERNAT